MIDELVRRHPPAPLAVALFGLFLAALTAFALFAWARHGAPRRWSALESYGFAALAVVGSLGWWWIDAPVEGEPTVVVSPRHGITYGDLLAIPALAAAAAVLVMRWAESARRRGVVSSR
jgi:apolipoprotein N-acyltransferase